MINQDCKSFFSGLGVLISRLGVLLLAGGQVHGRDSISLSGTEWRIHEDARGEGVKEQFFNAAVTDAGWIPAQVPGNIQADVEAAHLINPLWYGGVNTNLYEVARKDWWYRKDFMVPATYQGRRITLDFGGVDEHCKVWLNGTLIGENGGMFRRFWLDVSGVALPGQINHLAVQINRMPEQLVPILEGSDSAYNGPVGGLMDKTRQALKDLKAPGDTGFDWSANVWSLGIWRNVSLEASGPARIDWTRVETTMDNNYTHATVHATLEVDSLSDLPVRAEFKITGPGRSVSQSVKATLIKGTNLIKAELSLEHPALWWPNGQGEHPLYTLNAELESADGKVAEDKSSARFGVRELRWGFTEGAYGSKPTDVLNFNGRPQDWPLRQLRWLPHDSDPETFTNSYLLFVNGRPVRTIGSAPILPYLLPGCGEAHELQLLHFVKNAGMNFLRLNGGGGGPLFDDSWYDLADELGIMISFEYPVANTILDSDSVTLSNVDATCRSMIKQTRNHPAIIEYVGGSEMGAIDGDWNALVKSAAFILMKKSAAEENDRLFRVTDPELGSKHGPWVFNILQPAYSYSYFNGSNSDTMRYSEFGTASPANLEVWQREIPLTSQWPLDDVNEPVLIYHNAAKSAFTDIDWLFKPWIEAAFGPVGNLSEVVKGGQYIGAEGLRYEFDGLRRKGKRIGGISNHTFSEPWPNAAGSYMVDYDGRPLMNYDFLKQALAPVSLSLEMDSCLYTPGEGIQAKMFLVSDAPKAATGLRCQWVARDEQGKELGHGEVKAEINPLEVKSVGLIELHPAATAGVVFVELHLMDAKGKVLVERVQVFGRADQPHPMADLLKPKGVKRTSLEVSGATLGMEGEAEVYRLKVKNTGTMTALFCEPHPLLVYRTDVFVDNNHCFIPPGETREITIRSGRHAQSGLTLAQTGWTISSWNTEDATVAPSKDVVLSVGRWDQMCREYAGYFGTNAVSHAELTGSRPDPARLPYRLTSEGKAEFAFECTSAQAKSAMRLRIHTSDQSEKEATVVIVTINGRTLEQTLPIGLGIQQRDPAHRAFPATLEFELAGQELHAGKNQLSVTVQNHGWFSWDALDLVRNP